MSILGLSVFISLSNVLPSVHKLNSLMYMYLGCITLMGLVLYYMTEFFVCIGHFLEKNTLNILINF